MAYKHVIVRLASVAFFFFINFSFVIEKIKKLILKKYFNNQNT
jgi:hypothetical protein